MDALLKKLQCRPDSPITVLGAPDELRATVEGWSGDTTVRTALRAGAPFVLAFVRSRAELERRAPKVAGAAGDDAVVWFAYPKKSSPRYDSDLARDDSRQVLGDLGFEGVRQVAIDADWSALRFRRAEHIQTLARDPSRAMSRSGRARASRRPAPVDEFLARSKDGRRPLIEAVDATVRRAAPELRAESAGKFLGYGPFHYRYPTGTEGDTFVVSMMDGAQALSIYVLGGEGQEHLVEANAGRLGQVSVGKSCIRVKRLEHLDLDVLGELVRAAADQQAEAVRLATAASEA